MKLKKCIAAISAMFLAVSGSCAKQETGNGNHWVSGGGNKPSGNQYSWPKASDKTLRLMTYNSFYCKGNDSDPSKNGFSYANTAAFARVIKALAPDVIAIQELDKDASDRGRRNLLAEIAAATGEEWTAVFGEAADYAGGKIGPGLLVRKSLPVKSVRQVSIPGNEARVLIIAEFDGFVFIATHLDTDDAKRKSSASTINYESNKYDGVKPVFLAGDLNDSPYWTGGGAAFPVLKEEFEIKSPADGSLPAQNGQTIDWILYDANGTETIEFMDSHIVKSVLFGSSLERLDTVSDHYPVILDIELK